VVVTERQGFDPAQIQAQEVEIPQDARSLRPKIEEESMGLPAHDGLDVVREVGPAEMSHSPAAGQS
jgi:hypothetical protein